MKENLTELVFILDRSGSMAGLESDTIGGFNSMIEKQKGLDGEAIVSTVLFNHDIEVVHNRIDLKSIEPMTNRTYSVGGMTALLDAVGKSIHHIRTVFSETLKEERPSKMVFVITTDGMENSSKEYTYEKVKSSIQDVQQKYGWEFLFLGANIDAVDEAQKFGILEDHAANYVHDKTGTQIHYDAVNEAISSMRSGNTIKKSWKKSIDEDYSTRKK